jgi:hypothetical protein
MQFCVTAEKQAKRERVSARSNNSLVSAEMYRVEEMQACDREHTLLRLKVRQADVAPESIRTTAK